MSSRLAGGMPDSKLRISICFKERNSSRTKGSYFKALFCLSFLLLLIDRLLPALYVPSKPSPLCQLSYSCCQGGFLANCSSVSIRNSTIRSGNGAIGLFMSVQGLLAHRPKEKSIGALTQNLYSRGSLSSALATFVLYSRPSKTRFDRPVSIFVSTAFI